MVHATMKHVYHVIENSSPPVKKNVTDDNKGSRTFEEDNGGGGGQLELLASGTVILMNLWFSCHLINRRECLNRRFCTANEEAAKSGLVQWAMAELGRYVRTYVVHAKAD